MQRADRQSGAAVPALGRSSARRNLFDVGLALGLAGLVLVAVALSRRRSLPDVLGIEAARLEPVGHVVVAAMLTLVTAFLVVRFTGSRLLPRRAALAALGLVAVGTMVIEVAQIGVRNRAAGLEDMAANLVGAGLGAAASLLLMRLTVGTAQRLVAVVLVVGLVGGLWAALVEVPFGTACPTVVTDGVGGSSAGSPPTPSGASALATYDLAQASGGDRIVVAAEDGGSPLVADGEGRADQSEAGVAFVDDGADAFLVSADAGRAITGAVQAEGSVVVELVATPSAANIGPARIVTVSNGLSPNDVNIHLGQEGDDLSVRLRLTCGLNQTAIDGVFEDGRRRHIVMAFNDGTQRVWVDDELVDERTFTGDDVDTSNWDPEMPLAVGNEPIGQRQFLGEVELIRFGVAR